MMDHSPRPSDDALHAAGPIPGARRERGESIFVYSLESIDAFAGLPNPVKLVSLLLLLGVKDKVNELWLEPRLVPVEDGGEDRLYFIHDDPFRAPPITEVGGDRDGVKGTVDSPSPWCHEVLFDGRLIRRLMSPPPNLFDSARDVLRAMAGLDSPRSAVARVLRGHASRLDGSPPGPVSGRFHLDFEQFRVPITLTIEAPEEGGRHVLRFGREYQAPT